MYLGAWSARYARANLGLSRQSAGQLHIAVRRLEAWAGQRIRLEELSLEVVAGWLRALLESGAAPATVNSKRRAILTLWRAAYEERLAPPPPRIRPAREPQRLPDSWTLAQVSALLRHCQGLRGHIASVPRADWYTSLFLALYDSGERVGAVLAARVDDFDRPRQALLIRAEAHKCRRARLCLLAPDTADAIGRCLAAAPIRRLLWPWPMSRRHFFRSIRRVVEDAGLPASKCGRGLTYCLRCTAANLVEANGGRGELLLGNSRAVFVRHYLDPRVAPQGQLDKLPRPTI